MTGISSPCVGFCQLDERRCCRGCGRTGDEIAGWGSATAAHKLEIWFASRKRLRAMPRLDPASDGSVGRSTPGSVEGGE